MIVICESLSFRPYHTPKISSVDCVSLVWDSEKCLAVSLVNSSPSIPADSLLNLLEVVAGLE